MKKIIGILGVSFLLFACVNGTEEKTEEASDIFRQNMEQGAKEAYEFEKTLLSHIKLLDAKLRVLDDMDLFDTTSVVIDSSASNSITEADLVIDEITRMNAVGVGAGNFKDAALNLAKSFKHYAQGYQSMSDVFSVPDKEWSSEQTARFNEFDSIYSKPYFEAATRFNEEQINYFEENQLYIFQTINASSLQKSMTE